MCRRAKKYRLSAKCRLSLNTTHGNPAREHKTSTTRHYRQQYCIVPTRFSTKRTPHRKYFLGAFFFLSPPQNSSALCRCLTTHYIIAKGGISTPKRLHNKQSLRFGDWETVQPVRLSLGKFLSINTPDRPLSGAHRIFAII